MKTKIKTKKAVGLAKLLVTFNIGFVGFSFILFAKFRGDNFQSSLQEVFLAFFGNSQILKALLFFFIFLNVFALVIYFQKKISDKK